MNWKKKMSKIILGDTVRCIKNTNGRDSGEIENDGHNYGSGWLEGFEFKVTEITNDYPNSMRILWQGDADNGVYEDYVEKI